MSDYKKARAEREKLQAKAREREFRLDLSDVAEYVGGSIGIRQGQATLVTLMAKGEHATVGAVHVALSEDGKLVVDVEAEHGMEVEVRQPALRRNRWRFYDYWRHDKEKHDNVLRPESEWPREV